MRDVKKRVECAAVLLLLQGLLFNHIHLFGYATPLLYVYVLFLIPVQYSREKWLIWGFIVGLLSDFFTHAPGLGAASMTFAAMFTPRILQLFAPKDLVDDFIPSSRSLGWWRYIGYAIFVVMLHQAVILILEMFSFYHWEDMLYSFFGSTLLTVLLICLLEKMRVLRQ